MISTPSSFSYDYLNSLKFKELQKLSVQYRVNKRWAKKQELIENLLALREKNVKDQSDEMEWKDGSNVFSDVPLNNDDDKNRRLTFNVSSKSSVEKDSRLTFEIPQNKTLLEDTVNSRETFDIPPKDIDLGCEPIMNSRSTFDVPPKESLIDPRATFDVPQNGKSLLEENEIKVNDEVQNQKVDDSSFNKALEKISFDVTLKPGKEGGKPKAQVKTLTIPYARVTRRMRTDGDSTKDTIKMSQRSINIKKSTRLPLGKNNLLKSPASVKTSMYKQTVVQSLNKSQPNKNIQNKVPVKLQFSDENNKENVKKILKRRISKTAGEVLDKKQSSVKVNFRTPPPSVGKQSKLMPLKKTPLRKEGDSKLNTSKTQTPGCKSATKPITATKMPDFNRIHKRQFDQMDSLHDYIKKKEERIRKLFGTPQPRQPQAANRSIPVFQFRSGATSNKLNKTSETLKRLTTPMKKYEISTKSAQKEVIKSKLPPSKLQSDIKDKNRSQIHGVRTNKRFELQMKFRNLQTTEAS